MVLRLISCSPRRSGFCHRRLRIWRVKTRLGSHASANLTPASRRQNHTTSPYAKSAVRLRAIRQLTGLVDPPCHPLTSPDAAASTASRPAFVTTRDPPLLSERDGDGYRSDLGQAGTKIFLQKGLDSQFTDLPDETGQERRFLRVDVRFGL